jgi:hypothetical protein
LKYIELGDIMMSQNAVRMSIRSILKENNSGYLPDNDVEAYANKVSKRLSDLADRAETLSKYANSLELVKLQLFALSIERLEDEFEKLIQTDNRGISDD